MVELFSDEVESRCPECGSMVRDIRNNCAMWCPSADKCLGGTARR
ncbi:MAG TPA: hypothetical protein PKO25_09030 [Spirochaetota bacterium]|nr:hypothetical protein [Spirochaetota bacterium]HNU92003.1 hypothetical protein [Spirochaetota bacterium]HPI15990.1 hypothetical protein [Spirochaetota bacterium]HPV97896.1 hypothetical protein [Spirochaetota bacterium]